MPIIRFAAVQALCCLLLPMLMSMAKGEPVKHVTIRLWEKDAPGAVGSEDRDIPTLTLYQPDKAKSNGTAVVVCPGGGYGGLADHEGKPIAEWLNELGVTGLVLKYRLGPRYHHPVMQIDVNRAIRLVRSRSSEWGIKSDRIGVMGFSAGGHLASTAVTHFDKGKVTSAESIEQISSRPDFGILCYPVISMLDGVTHGGSKINLLGDSPSADLVTLMSNEKQVTKNTPPCFLMHTADDAAVPVENSLLFALALSKSGVPVELHLYEHGQHGVGLAKGLPAVSEWPTACANWLRARGLLAQQAATH